MDTAVIEVEFDSYTEHDADFNVVREKYPCNGVES